jgi:hypothetical protein
MSIVSVSVFNYYPFLHFFNLTFPFPSLHRLFAHANFSQTIHFYSLFDIVFESIHSRVTVANLISIFIKKNFLFLPCGLHM